MVSARGGAQAQSVADPSRPAENNPQTVTSKSFDLPGPVGSVSLTSSHPLRAAAARSSARCSGRPASSALPPNIGIAIRAARARRSASE